MNKILTVEQAIDVCQKLKAAQKTIVLAGGVFDILHQGHIAFLKKAGEQADILVVFLENDEIVKEKKGHERPYNTQQKRATVLSSFPFISYIIPLPAFHSDKEYDSLVQRLKPDIIATTKPDPNIAHKKRQAEKIGTKVVEVIEAIPNISTTEIAKSI